MKQSEFRRWLESQGVDVANGSNHLKLRFHGRRSVMPRHPSEEIKESNSETTRFELIAN